MKTKTQKFELLGLEKHKYAPELNKLHFIGTDTTISVKGATTIQEALQIAKEFRTYNLATFEDIDYLIENIK
jgi:hypothetical protein